MPNITVNLTQELISNLRKASENLDCSMSYAAECLLRAGAGLAQVPQRKPGPKRTKRAGRPGRPRSGKLPLPAKLVREIVNVDLRFGLGGYQAAVEAIWPGKGWRLEGHVLCGPGLGRDMLWLVKGDIAAFIASRTV